MLQRMCERGKSGALVQGFSSRQTVMIRFAAEEARIDFGPSC